MTADIEVLREFEAEMAKFEILIERETELSERDRLAAIGRVLSYFARLVGGDRLDNTLDHLFGCLYAAGYSHGAVRSEAMAYKKMLKPPPKRRSRPLKQLRSVLLESAAVTAKDFELKNSAKATKRPS